MSIKIRWDVPHGFWEEFAGVCPQATFYHTPGWYQAQAYRGYRLAPVHFRFPSGEEAMLPLALRKKFKGLVVEAQAGIEAGYGGLIAPQPLTREQIEAAYRLVQKRYPEFVVTSNPHEAFPNVPAELSGSVDHTQVVPLLPREEQQKLMTKGRRKSIKAALEESYDLTVIEGIQEKDVREFYPVYAEHSAEWGYDKWRRDEAYFRSLARHSGHKLVLFMAYQEGEPAGFRLLGCHGPVALALHLARAKRFSDWNIGPFLVSESMAWAYERGYQRLDFMPSGQLESVRSYKASYGAELVPYSVLSQTGWVSNSITRLLGRQSQVVPAA